MTGSRELERRSHVFNWGAELQGTLAGEAAVAGKAGLEAVAGVSAADLPPHVSRHQLPSPGVGEGCDAAAVSLGSRGGVIFSLFV